MNLRLITVVALVVVGVLGLALMLLDDGPGTLDLAGHRDADRPGEVRPTLLLPVDDARDPGAPLLGRLEGAPERLLPGPGAVPAVDLAPEAGAWVRGRVFDPSGAPIAAAPLVLLADDDPWQGRLRRRGERDVIDSQRSDAFGRFVLAARAGVPLVLVAGGERYGRLVLQPVAAGDELQLVLPFGLALSGTVIDGETGQPLPGAAVLSLSSDDRLLDTTDEQGEFALRPVPDGPVAMGAWLPGYDVGVTEGAVAGSSGLVLALPPGRTLAGLVIDAESRAPVPAAQVRLVVSLDARESGAGGATLGEGREDYWEASTASGDDGGFLFSGAPSRLFRLEVDAAGYGPLVRTRWEQRVLGPDETVVLELRPPRVIAGTVLDGDDERPVAGATVTLECPDGQLALANTDIDGAFALELGDWAGRGPLLVDAVDGSGRTAREVVRRQDDGLELRLVEPVSLELLVLAGGQPVPDAQVAVISKDAEPTLGRTDATGMARVVHRLAGPDVRQVVLEARAGSRASLPVGLDLSEGRPTVPVVIDLDLGARVAGLVVDPLGLPVSGALVMANGGVFGRTGAGGRFDLGPVSPDAPRIELQAVADGYRSAKLEAQPGQSDALLVLEPVVSWSVRVVDGTTGLGLDDAGGRLQREQSDPEGVDYHDTKDRLKRVGGEAGLFAVDLPQAGRFRLAVGAPDRIAQFGLPFDFDGVNAPPPLEVVLFRAAVLEVELTDSANRPVPGVSISVTAVPDGMADLPDKLLARGRPAKGVREATTDGAGLVRFNLGDGGLFRLGNGRLSWLFDRPVAVAPGPPTRQRVPIGSSGSLAVEVRDERGFAVGGASVNVRSEGRPRPFELRRKRQVPNDGSTAEFEVLPEAVYRVQVSGRGFASSSDIVQVSAGSRAWLAVTLHPAPPASSKAPKGGRGRDKRNGR